VPSGHTDYQTTQSLQQHEWQRLENPLYVPDFTPSDMQLICLLKKNSGVRNSQNIAQLQEAVSWTVRGSIPGGSDILRTCPDRPWGLPSSCTMGTGSIPGVKSERGVTPTPHPLLVTWSRKSRAIPLVPLRAVQPVQSLSACTVQL